MYFWRISWRNLTSKKYRTLFTVIAIALGVGATLAVTSAVETTRHSVANYVQSVNDKSDMQVRSSAFTFSDRVIDPVQKALGVSATLAHLYQPAKIEMSSLSVQPGITEPNNKVLLHGYDKLDSPILDWRIVEGDLRKQGLVITSITAKRWQVTIGSQVSLLVGDHSRTMPVTAIVAPNETLTAPSDWNKSTVSRWHVAVPLEWLQEWSGLNGQVREVHIRVMDGQGPMVAAQIEPLLKPFPNAYLDPALINESDLLYGLDDIYLGMRMLGILGLLMSAMILFSTLYVSVTERRREFAIMKTMGCTPQQIASMVLREVLLVAILGTAAGLALGFGLAYGMTYGFMELLDDIEGPSTAGLIVSWESVAYAVATGVGGSVLAALLPLFSAARVSVSYALRQSVDEPTGRLGWIRAIAGVILSGAGLWMSGSLRVLPLFIGLLLIFPILMRIVQILIAPVLRVLFRFEGTIASASVARKLQRASITTGILCIGLAFLLVVGSIRGILERSMEESVRSMVGGDVIVSTSTPLTPEDVQEIRKVDGVAGASLVKEASVLWKKDEKTRKLLASGVQEMSSDSIPLFTSDETPISAIIERLREPRTVALGHAVYEAWGGKIGESITLSTPKGEQNLKVVAVVFTVRENGYTVFLSDSRMQSEFGKDNSTRMAILAEPGASFDVLKTGVLDHFGERLSGLRVADEYLQSRKAESLIPFTMLNVLLAITVLVSGVGILNTLIMNVLERTREYAIMRAVASTPRQVRKIVVAEGLSMGLSAACIGIGLGLALVYSVTADTVISGIPLSFRIHWEQVGITAGFGIAVAFVSALVPARMASNAPFHQALNE